jgi:hypothetical protein
MQKCLINFFFNLSYVDPFDYKLTIIKNVYLFKVYIDTTYDDEGSLRFVIHYSKSQCKRYYLSIDIFYVKSNMKELKLISKIIVHPKKKENRLKSLEFIHKIETEVIYTR